MEQEMATTIPPNPPRMKNNTRIFFVFDGNSIQMSDEISFSLSFSRIHTFSYFFLQSIFKSLSISASVSLYMYVCVLVNRWQTNETNYRT